MKLFAYEMLLKITQLLVLLAGLLIMDAHAASWSAADIGAGVPGTESWQNDTLTLGGAGTGDAGHFVYQRMTGDFELAASIQSLPAVGRIGLMIRESLDAGARFKLLYLDPAGIPRSDARIGAGRYQAPQFLEMPKPVPMRLKLSRYGDKVGLYVHDPEPATPPRVKDRGSLRGLAQTLYVGVFINSDNPTITSSAVVTDLKLGPLKLDYQTSWLGNSYAGVFHAVQQQVQSMAVERTTGRIFMNSVSDEGDKFGGIYSPDGDQISCTEKSADHNRSGYGVAVTSTAAYWTCRAFDTSDAYSIYKTDLMGATIKIPNADIRGHIRVVNRIGDIRGLATSESAKEVYSSNTPSNEIVVYDLELGLKRRFPFERPGPLAVDPSGDLWIVQLPLSDSPGSGGVWRYSTAGTAQSHPITTGLANPLGIAVAPDGSLWVAEAGPRSCILKYNADGLILGTFGADGGVQSSYAGTKPGQTHPLKFNGPAGVGFDAQGNIVVAANPGPVVRSTELRKFTPSGSLLWELYGLEVMDTAAAEPGTDGVSLYTESHRYEMDYSRGPGQGWRYAAYTIDPVKYPEDPRLLSSTVAPLVRVIGGRKVMFTFTGVGECVASYRFRPNSEIAVPTLMIRTRDHKTKEDPAEAPATGAWIWRDQNANGRMEAGEFATIPYTDVRSIFVDDGGGLWMTQDDGSFVHIICTGLDASDVPVYDLAGAEVVQPPTPFTTVGRIHYESETDTLYLGGYTPESPREGREWKTFGREVAVYPGWSAGRRTPSLRFTIPYTPKLATGGDDTYAAQNLCVAGQYIFVSISATGEVVAYDRATGARKAILNPGPEVEGRTGLIDITLGTTAFRRANGEYIILVESNDQAKILMYRWNPDPLYALTVQNGSGSGNYPAGTRIAIAANPPTPGRTFVRWDGPVADPLAAVTEVVIGNEALTVSAIYGENQAPALLSAPVALPNPATVSDAVQFTAAATDSENDPLAYRWSFSDGTEATGQTVTKRFTAPGIYTATLSVTDDFHVTTATCTLTVNAAAASIRINFQPANAPTVAGYRVDSGAPYGDRGDGFSYGWNADLSSTARDRNVKSSPDQCYDTLIHLQKLSGVRGVWELAVPPGDYRVRAVAGDSSYFDSVYSVDVEGQPLLRAKPTTLKRWAEAVVTCQVTDGRLTISSGADAVNNKLCFLVVEPVAGLSSGALPEGEPKDYASLEVQLLRAAVKLRQPPSDTLALSAKLIGLEAEAVVSGADLQLDVAGAVRDFKLDHRGAARSANGSVHLIYRKSQGGWTLKAFLRKGAWAMPWSEAGLYVDGVSASGLLPVSVTLGDITLAGEKVVVFKGRAGTGGKIK